MFGFYGSAIKNFKGNNYYDRDSASAQNTPFASAQNTPRYEQDAMIWEEDFSAMYRNTGSNNNLNEKKDYMR